MDFYGKQVIKKHEDLSEGFVCFCLTHDGSWMSSHYFRKSNMSFAMLMVRKHLLHTIVLMFGALWFGACNAVLRCTCQRTDSGPDIVYYFSAPTKKSKKKSKNYPIVMLCEGSSSKDDLKSVLFIRQHFSARIDALHCGLITVEQWGIDGNTINEKEFWSNYTRSQRLKDHRDVINYLEAHPPDGWDGTLIFIGVSEGGPLVNQLSVTYHNTRATINFVGAGDWGWADEFWEFFESLKKNNFLFWLYDLLPRWLPFSSDIPKTREEFDQLVKYIQQNPLPNTWLGGMTYLYHADAFEQKPLDYSKIYAPMLIVAGAQDSVIKSCDEFVHKAQSVRAPITYFRIKDMDHWIRKRPDVIDKSFDWLKQQIVS